MIVSVAYFSNMVSAWNLSKVLLQTWKEFQNKNTVIVQKGTYNLGHGVGEHHSIRILLLPTPVQCWQKLSSNTGLHYTIFQIERGEWGSRNLFHRYSIMGLSFCTFFQHNKSVAVDSLRGEEILFPCNAQNRLKFDHCRPEVLFVCDKVWSNVSFSFVSLYLLIFFIQKVIDWYTGK